MAFHEVSEFGITPLAATGGDCYNMAVNATGEDNANLWDRLLDALTELDVAVDDLRARTHQCRSVNPAPEVGDAAFEIAFLRQVAAQRDMALLAALVRPL